jgi:hypothetical protein
MGRTHDRAHARDDRATAQAAAAPAREADPGNQAAIEGLPTAAAALATPTLGMVSNKGDAGNKAVAPGSQVAPSQVKVLLGG